MLQVEVDINNLTETIYSLMNLNKQIPFISKHTEIRTAQSVQAKAKFIVDSETTAHTGLLRSDIRIKPVGQHYKVVTGEYASYAILIERGRREIVGRKFIPTQRFPLEGYSVPSADDVIKPFIGIRYMERAAEHGRDKIVGIFIDEWNKLTGRKT